MTKSSDKPEDVLDETLQKFLGGHGVQINKPGEMAQWCTSCDETIKAILDKFELKKKEKPLASNPDEDGNKIIEAIDSAFYPNSEGKPVLDWDEAVANIKRSFILKEDVKRAMKKIRFNSDNVPKYLKPAEGENWQQALRHEEGYNACIDHINKEIFGNECTVD